MQNRESKKLIHMYLKWSKTLPISHSYIHALKKDPKKKPNSFILRLSARSLWLTASHRLSPPLAELSFRWMLNEFPFFIPLDKRRFVSQTTGNLYISKVDRSDTGNYSCFVSSPSISKSVFSKFIPLVPLAERKYALFSLGFCMGFLGLLDKTHHYGMHFSHASPPPLPTLISLCCCFVLMFNRDECVCVCVFASTLRFTVGQLWKMVS